MTRSVGWIGICLLIAFLYDVIFLHIFSQWWFEDDPLLFAYAKSVANPLAFFGRETLQQFGPGASLVPFQAISEWLDGVVAYRSLPIAHLHNVVSLSVALILLFRVLRRFGLSPFAAFFLCLLWLCLPATIVVNEFLSARHYLEGVAASLLAMTIAQEIGQGVWKEDLKAMALLLLSLSVAMLCKELFAITVPLLIAIYLFEKKRGRAAVAAVLLMPAYIAYRYWALGGSVSWGSPFLGPKEYAQYLSRMPYILVGNFGGYLLLGLFVALLVAFGRRQKMLGRLAVYAVLLILSCLAVIYPVSYPVTHEWRDHGTWSRVMLLLSSGLLLAGGIFCCRTQSRIVRISTGILAAGVLFCGAAVTQAKWQTLMRRYEREGKFYLKHSERLVYSEVPMASYLDGLRVLFEIPTRHHIVASERSRPPAGVIERYDAIWRLVNGRFKRDRRLFRELQANAALP